MLNFQSARLRVPLAMTFSALTTTSFYQVVVWLSPPASQFSSRQELMDVLHHALDSP